MISVKVRTALAAGKERGTVARSTNVEKPAVPRIAGSTKTNRSQRWDSNPQPAVYKTAALPIELHWRKRRGIYQFTHVAQHEETSPASRPGVPDHRIDKQKNGPEKISGPHERFRQQPTFTPLGTIIGPGNLNRRVRNGSGVCHQVWSPENPQRRSFERRCGCWQCI